MRDIKSLIGGETNEGAGEGFISKDEGRRRGGEDFIASEQQV